MSSVFSTSTTLRIYKSKVRGGDGGCAGSWVVQAYVNRPESGAMPRRHILIHGLHGIAARHLAVLLVHVVRARAAVVADPDAEVFDFLRALFLDLHCINKRPTSPSQSCQLFWGRRTLLSVTTSPLAFLTFFSLAKKYQNRLLATTSLGAKMRMR